MSSGRDSYCVPERTTIGVWPALLPRTQVQAVYRVCLYVCGLVKFELAVSVKTEL